MKPAAPPAPKLKGLSLFSGAGGMDIGLEVAGFDPLACFEIEKNAQETLRANRPSWNVPFDGDVVAAARDLKPKDLGLEVGELDLISGGPPCQPFSTAAQWAATGRLGMNDLRANTVHALLDLIGTFRPRAVLLENVRGFVSGANSALPELESRLARINEETGCEYRVQWRLLNSAHYGVPQNRLRVIVVILRDGQGFPWPQASHETAPLTSWDALAGFDEPTPPEASGKWTPLLASIPNGRNYQWLTKMGGGPELFGYRTKYWNFLLKLDPDSPSWTLPASPGPSTGPFHWDNRPLSPREMLRLQSFPADWVLTGDRREQTRLAGNATPPLLVEVVGRRLANLLHGVDHGSESPELILAMIPTNILKPSEALRPVPDSFEKLVGDKSAHAGTGQGPAPRRAAQAGK